MFKTWLLALLFFFLSGTTLSVGAADPYITPVCVTVNGVYIRTDSPAFLEKGTTYLPIRAVSEALCADKVVFDSTTDSASIVKGNTTIRITKNKKQATVNGKSVSLNTAAFIMNDRFYVPLRFLAETLSFTVSWNADTYTAALSSPGVTVPAASVGNRGYSDDDLYWLSRIIHAESEGEPMKGKIAVGNVVLNRVSSPLFDNNIYSVIFDKKYGVQFTPTANGAIYKTPAGDSIKAAKLALSGTNTVGSCLYFLNVKSANNFWIVNNRPFYKTIGNHDFYL